MDVAIQILSGVGGGGLKRFSDSVQSRSFGTLVLVVPTRSEISVGPPNENFEQYKTRKYVLNI